MRSLSKLGLSLLVAVFLLSIAGMSPALAQQPERDISVTTTYPHVVVPLSEAGNAVKFKVTVANRGKVAEDVNLSASTPEGWKCQFESGYPKKIVRAVYLPPRDKKNSQQELTLKVMPPSGVKGKDYQVTVKAKSSDGKVSDSVLLTLTFSSKAAPSKPGGVELSTESTTLEQTAGKSFEFSIKVHNKGEESRRFDFGLTPTGSRELKGWTAYLTKGYKGTRIRNLKIDAGAAETVKLHLKPPSGVQAGKYPVKFTANAGKVSDSIELKAVISGTYKLSLSAPKKDRRLNTKATAGKTTKVPLVLKNNGSTALEDISFSSLNMPEGWNVGFSPHRIDTLEPGAKRTIEVAIQPGSKTIAGDYMIELKASSSQAKDSLDYRVTVETPTTWGWVGVAIVVIVIGGLFGVFYRVRRR